MSLNPSESICSYCGQNKERKDIALLWLSFGLFGDYVVCGDCYRQRKHWNDETLEERTVRDNKREQANWAFRVKGYLQ